MPDVLKIPLTQGKFALIDHEDFHLIVGRKWSLKPDKRTFYASAWGRGAKSSTTMHRVIVNPPPGFMVDHINGDGLDNRRCNLRVATRSENARNRTKQRRQATSKFKGMYWNKRIKKWHAQIRVGGKARHLGFFDSETTAAMAYDAAAMELHGSFANCNFPEDYR